MKDLSRWIVLACAFAVPFVPLIIANHLFFPYITGKNFTFRILVEVMTTGWIILALYDAKYRPKFSWIVVGFVLLLVVMFFADLFGQSPLKSFWSNYERMEGYVTLAHLFLYMLVLGSVLTTEKLWTKFLNTALVAAIILALYAFAQLSGQEAITQGGWRLTGTLGNSAYMAIYALFNIFIAGLLIVRTKSKFLRYLYIAFIALFVFLMITTATRGTVLGLVGGAFLTTIYLALFTKGHPRARKVAAGSILAIVVIVGLFVAFRHSPLIQDNRYLGRVANISLSEGNVRFMIWDMAIQGIKERPILGWGQGNFNYVFNKYYNPELYSAEQWYDRVHDIFFDWLITGGILGFLAYFSILVAALYYLFYLPLVKKDESFTVAERAVLIGLLAGYTFHNIFVFDNIVSYIFYGTILAYIHSRVGREIPKVAGWEVDHKVIEQVAAPVIGIGLVAVLYFVNVPAYLAANDIIDAFSSQDPNVVLNDFEKALSRGSFANQEIREQLTQRAQAIINTANMPTDVKDRAFSLAESELKKEIAEKPGDARVEVFLSSFYRTSGHTDQALEEVKIARALSPKKQQIIFEQGLAELQLGKFDDALTTFKDAYDLEHAYSKAAIYYAVAALYDDKPEMVKDLINTDVLMKQFANDQLALQAAYKAKQYDLLEQMFQVRIDDKPTDPQLRVNLAVIKNEQGDTQGAIDVLTKAGEDIPSFKPQADKFIADLKAGRVPGSQPTVNVNGQQVKSTTVSLPVSN